MLAHSHDVAQLVVSTTSMGHDVGSMLSLVISSPASNVHVDSQTVVSRRPSRK
jgi:hypothetical protein